MGAWEAELSTKVLKSQAGRRPGRERHRGHDHSVGQGLDGVAASCETSGCC